MPCEVVIFRAETASEKLVAIQPSALAAGRLSVWSRSHSAVANRSLRARRAVSLVMLIARRVRISIRSSAVMALAGSIARHSNRIARSVSAASVGVESVADVDPQLVGRWKVGERALGEGFQRPGAAGVGASAGEGLGVQVDGPRERDAVPGRDAGADREVGVGGRRRLIFVTT